MWGRWLALFGALTLISVVSARAEVNPLDVTAKSAIIIDAKSGVVLWEKNADAKCYPASTTKIMTALVLLENRKLADVITAPDGIEKVPPSSMYLRPGEQITVHDLVYAMLLHSANDAAVAVAWNVAGSREKFADMMNEEARRLGCTNTHFDNPNGLDDPNHWTTASDMAKIAKRAMEIPFFRQVVSTKAYTVDRSINQKNRVMINRNKLLWRDPTDNGIKTGWTVPAGHCFVGSCSRDGFDVITVEFDSKNWTSDEQKMTNWAFASFEPEVIRPEGTQLGTAKINGVSVPIGLTKKLTAVLPRDADPKSIQVSWILNTRLHGDIAASTQIGKVIASAPDGTEIGEAPLTALADVKIPEPHRQSQGSKLAWFVLGGCMIGGAIYMRSKGAKLGTGKSLRF